MTGLNSKSLDTKNTKKKMGFICFSFVFFVSFVVQSFLLNLMNPLQ
jgi:hypothetical protein